MFVYDWIIANHDILSLVYAALVVVACGIIVYKSDKLFRLSFHQGIRYFRNAFLFAGIAFFVRFFIGELLEIGLMNYIFEFFMILSGFTLLYSLVWKNFENVGESPHSSLFNPRILIFSFMALILSILDYLWGVHLFMFVSQIIIFLAAAIISLFNCRKNECEKDNFLKFYFVAMLLSLFAWLLNFLLEVYFKWHPTILLGVYGINIVIFILFLYGVIKFGG